MHIFHEKAISMFFYFVFAVIKYRYKTSLRNETYKIHIFIVNLLTEYLFVKDRTYKLRLYSFFANVDCTEYKFYWISPGCSRVYGGDELLAECRHKNYIILQRKCYCKLYTYHINGWKKRYQHVFICVE